MNLCTCPVLVQRHGEMVVLTPCAFVSAADGGEAGCGMIATDLILTIREREWVALMEERCRETGYVLVGLARRREGLALGLGDIVLSDAEWHSPPRRVGRDRGAGG